MALVIRELTTVQPIVNLRLFKSRAFAISCSVMFAFGFIINSSTQMLPQFTQQILPYNATKAGLTLMPGGLVMMVLMPVAGILVRKVQPAAEIVREMNDEANAILRRLGQDCAAP